MSKDEWKRPQRDENSPEIPLGFPEIPRLPDTEMPQQLIEFFFARGKHNYYFVTKIRILQDVPNVYKWHATCNKLFALVIYKLDSCKNCIKFVTYHILHV